MSSLLRTPLAPTLSNSRPNSRPNSLAEQSPDPLATLLKERALWRGDEPLPPPASISTGFPAIDSAIGGLARSALHEFSLSDTALSQGEKKRWHTPFLFLSPLLAQITSASPLPIFWVGKRCWPTPFVTTFIEQLRSLSVPKLSPHSELSILGRSLLINPENRGARLWSILEALKHSSAVIADGSRFSFQESRRLHLRVAESNSILFLIRPPWESTLQSSAHTRWEIAPQISSSDALSWKVTLLKARGFAGTLSWTVHQDETIHGTTSYRCILSDVKCGSDQAESDQREPDQRESNQGGSQKLLTRKQG